MDVAGDILEQLLAGAGREELEATLARAEREVEPRELARVRDLAARVRDQMERQRSREAELSGLYETARDLTAIRDLDEILAAIVRRARQLLGADMTYLSLNDEADGASYMKVTDGALTPEFRTLRLPFGTGLLGLVAQAGAPYFTEDYQADERFVHREYIDTAVDGEQIRAILGVPLEVEGTVIGALLAVHRRVRPFPADEVTLLTSFAAHAAVALENARLFQQARDAAAAADAASAELRARAAATERAAHAHDLLTDVLLHRGGVVEVGQVLAEVLGGHVEAYDEDDRQLAGQPAAPPDGLADAVARARTSGRCTRTDAGVWVAAATAGDEHLATLVLRTDGPMGLPERRTLERAALVTAMVLLFGRSEAEAESRVRGELVADLLAARSQDPERLRVRARQQGADVDGDLAVAVARHASERAGQRVVGSLARELRGLGTVHEGQVVLVARAEPVALGEQLRDRLGGATVGVSHVEGGLTGVAAAWREARRTLGVLYRLGRTGEVGDPAALGLARLLLGDNGPAEVEEFVDRTIGPLLRYDAERDTRLVETLAVWLDASGGLRDTAERLHVHPNTVTQRLDRVGRLLGPDWRQGARRLDVHLAVQTHRLRDLM
ncbi:helix-turn-helix domain-containing protein [Nocardioides aurantiacus]|uniref:GAF domain-containing protein n=1 Tax=Nocardioides aurantiacus TaxID=86796 RepID=A0A3N2CXH1_9ACTN|nr:GAF domain-containing protein [Nocardioides aurantiacus]ROR92240.1 GAF domain-containing protein [Nocardioides aurantiacus]